MQHRSQPNKEYSSQNIMAVILQSLPQEAALTKIEYEGPRIALYSKSPTYLMQNNQLVSNMVNTIKKRIVVRTDESIRKPEEESIRIIQETIPKEIGVIGTFFDQVLGEAVLFVKKPWMLAQVGDEFDSVELADKTGWKVQVRKAPQDISVIKELYRVFAQTVVDRRRFYREVGDKIFRERLGDHAEASLITLGGFAELGRSCFLIATRDSKILVDCGISLSAKDSLTAMPRFDIAGFAMDEIDGVVISHAHLDHSGFLPALFKYGYAGPVYCTEPTLLLMSMLQRECVRLANKYQLYSDRDVDNAIMHTITLTHGIVTDISPDVKLVLYNSGHVLGSASIHFHIGNGDHNLVYTGDMKFGRTLSLENASWNFPRVETMIIESTYGGKEDIMDRPEEAEATLIDLINSTTASGGHVLLPVPSVGISQELLLLLDRCMRQGRLQRGNVLVEKLVSAATTVYEAYPEYLARDLRERVLKSEGSPFSFADRFATVDSATLGTEASIVLAPSSTLAGGPSVHYLKQIAGIPDSRLIIVSYQPPETPGRAILEGSRQISVNGENIDLRCKVDKVDGFASHSDYNQLLAYVSRLRPKLRRVIVNHGERAKAQNLASSINRMFKIPTQHPLVQEAIKLL